MHLTHLSLTNFKNIAEARLEFSPNVNCLLGRNGMGKSNLLDAIFCLSYCRSFTGVPDGMLIRRGEDFAMIRGEYLRGGMDEEITIGMAAGKRKAVRRGGKEYGRLRDHIGKFPIVMSAPQDVELVRGGGEERRRWMDLVISQADGRYLDALMRYRSALEQRNTLLRQQSVDHTLYEAVETVMEMAASVIHRTRAEWIGRLGRMAGELYMRIAPDSTDCVGLTYRSDMAGGKSLEELLDGARRHDEAVRHTSVGPHRDDMEITINDMPMRRTGSQGQCKTFTVALRLAQYEFLRETSRVSPLLLLDDVFDKLDAARVERIMELVTSDAYGQIFVTDTNRRHLDEIMSHTSGHYALWGVDRGNFTPL